MPSKDPNRKLKKRERADGRFQKSIVVGHKEDGKPIRKVFYGKSKADVEQKAQEYLDLQSKGYKLDKLNCTLDEFLNVTESVYHYVSSSYVGVYNHIRKDLGQFVLSEITELDLMRALAEHTGLKRSWYVKYRRVLKKIFNAATRNKYLIDNPAENLDIPEGEADGTHRALEEWEIAYIREHVTASSTWFCLNVLLLTGLRIGEYAYLPWENIDFDNNVIHVRGTAVQNRVNRSENRIIYKNITKTKAGMRDIPIVAPLRQILEMIPEGYRKDRYWQRYNFDGTPCDQSSKNGFEYMEMTAFHMKALNKEFDRDFQSWGKQHPEYKVPPVRKKIQYHDARHTFATDLYEANVDVKTAQLLLGHSSLQTTQEIYQHLSDNKKSKSVDSLKAYMADKYK